MGKLPVREGWSILLVLGITLVILPAIQKVNNKPQMMDTALPYYTAIDIGTPEGKPYFVINGISPNGKYLVGYISTRYGMRAFRWHEGQFQQISAVQSTAAAVNDAGDVALEILPDEWSSRPLLWKNGETKRIFPDNVDAHVKKLDNDGTIYGYRSDPNAGHVWRAFFRRSNGALTYLDTEPNRNSFLHAVNKKQQITLNLSSRTDPDPNNSPSVLWTKGKTTSLPPLEPGNRCFPNAINNHGVVVGSCQVDKLFPQPVRWKNGNVELLKTPRCHAGTAAGINDQGDVFGTICVGEKWANVPFIIHQGTFYDFNDFISNNIRLDSISGPTASGVLLGSTRESDRRHTYLLIPN